MVKNSRDFRVYENKIPLRLCASAFFKINPLFRDNTIKNSPLGGWGASLGFFFAHFLANIRFFNYFCKVFAKDGIFVTQAYMRQVNHDRYLPVMIVLPN
jgi:hypothetical protein